MAEAVANVRLIRATRADQSAIRALIAEGKINPFGVHWQNFVVALDGDERVVGCAQRKPHRGDVFELASVAVTAQMQGNGVARLLIERVQEMHEQLTPTLPLWLMCASDLESLYNKFGFMSVADRRQMVGYFGRIYRLANAFSRTPRLSIMVWCANDR